MSKPITAWHFWNEGDCNGERLPDAGKWLGFDSETSTGKSGYHASMRVIDAFIHSPGQTLCRVECRGNVEHSEKHFVCQEKKILWSMDATALLIDASRKIAQLCVDKWNAPDLVHQWLESGEESKREAVAEIASLACSAMFQMPNHLKSADSAHQELIKSRTVLNGMDALEQDSWESAKHFTWSAAKSALKTAGRAARATEYAALAAATSEDTTDYASRCAIFAQRATHFPWQSWSADAGPAEFAAQSLERDRQEAIFQALIAELT